MNVMNQQFFLPRVRERHHFRVGISKPDTFIGLSAEHKWLTIAQTHSGFRAINLARDRIDRAIIEDHTVHHDLDECDPLMIRRCGQNLGQQLIIRVMGSRDKGRTGGKCHRNRTHRIILHARGSRLGLGSHLRGRRSLSLGQTVNLIIEQDHFDVRIPPHHVNEVVSADRKPVTIAGHDPDRKIRTGKLQAHRDSGSTSVNRMESVGAGIIRKPR